MHLVGSSTGRKWVGVGYSMHKAGGILCSLDNVVFKIKFTLI